MVDFIAGLIFLTGAWFSVVNGCYILRKKPLERFNRANVANFSTHLMLIGGGIKLFFP